MILLKIDATHVIPSYALKIQTTRNKSESKLRHFIEDAEKEFAIQRVAADHGMAPRVLRSWKHTMRDSTSVVVVMDLIQGTVGSLISDAASDATRTDADFRTATNLLLDKVSTIAKFFCQHKIIHGDFHTHNIAYVTKPGDEDAGMHLLVIDFGQATRGVRCHPILEWLQFVRSLYIDQHNLLRKVSNSARRQLIRHRYADLIDRAYGKLRSAYSAAGKRAPKNTDSSIDKEHHEVHRAYMKDYYYRS